MKRNLMGAAQRFAKSLRSSARARGDAARDAGNWAAAVTAYEMHLESTPDDVAIWIQLGHASKEAGDFDDALRAYERAQALDPHDADLLLNLGHLHKVRGRLDLAAEAYRASAALQPALFAGAAMIAREQILGRTTWRDEDHGVPSTLPDLLAVIDQAERSGRHIFQGYYRSFETR